MQCELRKTDKRLPDEVVVNQKATVEHKTLVTVGQRKGMV